MADSASADPAPAPTPAADAASTARRGAKPCIFRATRDVAKPVNRAASDPMDVTGVDGFTGYDYDEYTGDLIRRGGDGRDVPAF